MSDITLRISPIVFWLALAGLLSALAAVVFAGWLKYGAAIVLTYAENGLSLCF
ncbi:hypothetical protein ACQQ2Q_11225 [Agrobacterium sp. ES01]|uniref:hypothetical protein n=1 Tax=Agrobacterium sp. ES01 TaxID=3420714 RepID=UPI003D13CCD2